MCVIVMRVLALAPGEWECVTIIQLGQVVGYSSQLPAQHPGQGDAQAQGFRTKNVALSRMKCYILK